MKPTDKIQTDRANERIFRHAVITHAAQAFVAGENADAYHWLERIISEKTVSAFRKAVTKRGGDTEEALYCLLVAHLAATGAPMPSPTATNPTSRRKRGGPEVIDPNQMDFFATPPPVPVENN